MEMALRTSNLILPQGFVEMDREEMMYVDGGFYITNNQLWLVLQACALSRWCNFNRFGDLQTCSMDYCNGSKAWC